VAASSCRHWENATDRALAAMLILAVLLQIVKVLDSSAWALARTSA
jgi:hypothetical protein